MAAKVFTIGGAAISYGGYRLRDTGNGSLTISKTVSGSGFDPSKTFKLTVTFSAPVTYNGTTSATHTFNLAHGQSVTITNIPEFTSYAVTETITSQDTFEGYALSSITGGSGVVRDGTAATAAASNTFTEPPHVTFRFRFSDGSYDPTVSFATTGYEPCKYVWTRVSSSPNVWDCRLYRRTPISLAYYVVSAFNSYGTQRYFGSYPSDQTIVLVDADLSGYTEDVDYLFDGCTQLSTIESFRGTSGVTSFHYAFAGTGITSCPLFDTSACETFAFMFSWCRSLTSSPLFNTSAGTDFEAMFNNCDSLRAVPRLSMPNAESVSYMFYKCRRVASGALALYQDLAALPALSATSTHTLCFGDCGTNTVTGATELAQIPSDWKS